MPPLGRGWRAPEELRLGRELNARVPESDQRRQREEVEEVLRRLERQPGVIVADEVGMGKTYVALAVAWSVAERDRRGPVIVMVPANLVGKWEQDLKTFCELYLRGRRAVERSDDAAELPTGVEPVRFGSARHSIELLRLLDDPKRERCHLIFLAQGAMHRGQNDKWIRLALIAEALRRHGRGAARRLIEVKKTIDRYMAKLVRAQGSERASDLGEELWRELLRYDPRDWRRIHNESIRDERRHLRDDPVPKSVQRALGKCDLRELAAALTRMPIRWSKSDRNTAERIARVRGALRGVEKELWKELLARATWRSPLLVMDEAHHLKNPGTGLARQLQSAELSEDLRTGDGALANAFERMLFLTATPFQLGHRELVRVLERFADVRWNRKVLGEIERFRERIRELERRLDDSQRTAIGLQRSWSRLGAGDCDGDAEAWWRTVRKADREELPYRTRAVLDAFQAAVEARGRAEEALRPWIVRHSKGSRWIDTEIDRRLRLEGGAIVDGDGRRGVPVPPEQLLPFFLAARSSAGRGKDLLGEALSSSYEAFRETRQDRRAKIDEVEDGSEVTLAKDATHSKWFLERFDESLAQHSGAVHPKVSATVRRVIDLWESGEKVLVFAFYRLTCRALREHISVELERRVTASALRRLAEAGRPERDEAALDRLVTRIQQRYFDDIDRPGRRAVDRALKEILATHDHELRFAGVTVPERETLEDVMRRFLRVKTTILRCFPIAELDGIRPESAVERTLAYTDRSKLSWREKLSGFVQFLAKTCSTDERRAYLEAAGRTQTGEIRIESRAAGDRAGSRKVLANVQVATGETLRDQRARLMRAFNTPFFPDILVCSEVMGEGVDLQRFCRHVIHHDLAWNPSAIEQRTGRIDRLGCKAEGQHPIEVYLPYLAGAADERQFRVMSDRERWFRVVMGEDEVAKLIAPEREATVPLPESVAQELSFDLSIRRVRRR